MRVEPSLRDLETDREVVSLYDVWCTRRPELRSSDELRMQLKTNRSIEDCVFVGVQIIIHVKHSNLSTAIYITRNKQR